MTTATTEMTEPSSLEEARRLRDDLLLDIQKIQADLGSEERRDEEGRLLSLAETKDWRHRAKVALAHKLREYRSVKQWIAEHGAGSKSHGRIEGSAQDFVSATRFVTGGVGRLLNIYEAAVALLDEDIPEHRDTLDDAISEFEALVFE